MNFYHAAMIVKYGGSKPEHMSGARWAAIARFVRRVLAGEITEP